MATTIIKNSIIKINGVPMIGSMNTLSAHIGTTEVNEALSKKSVSSTSTRTVWPGIILSAGTWLVNYIVSSGVNGNNSGNFCILLQDANASIINYSIITGGPANKNGWTVYNLFKPLVFSTEITVYPAMYQQSGTTMTNVTGYFHAIKI